MRLTKLVLLAILSLLHKKERLTYQKNMLLK